jgi:hypothetical protein
VAFAHWTDYRNALRDHRGWPITAAFFLLALAPSLAMTWLGLWIIGLDRDPSLGWVIAVSVAALWTWTEAAHRVAGKRMDSRP